MGHKNQWPDVKRYQKAKAALRVVAHRCSDWPDKMTLARQLPTVADESMLEVLRPFAKLVRQAVINNNCWPMPWPPNRYSISTTCPRQPCISLRPAATPRSNGTEATASILKRCSPI
ncbi:MAG: hypothetical protein HN348_12775 [Proteobacteria bacterium]|nr:hypothetical protein [Pseudomonadota bacterium]